MEQNQVNSSDRVCQLEIAAEACTEPTRIQRGLMRMEAAASLAWVRLQKVLRNPGWAVRRVLSGPADETPTRPSEAGRPLTVTLSSPLGLQPGDRVRVLSRQEIDATLDEDGRCEGMGYIPAVMDRFCGGTFTVKKRVDRFFDERTFKMLRLRNSVILDAVHCEPDSFVNSPFAGCQRTCFLFWKEAWLRKLD